MLYFERLFLSDLKETSQLIFCGLIYVSEIPLLL